MKWNPEKSCFVADDGSKLKPTRSLVGDRFGNLSYARRSKSQIAAWLTYLTKELAKIPIDK